MRAVIQRVTQARVEVDGTIVGAIHAGLCVLIGVAVGDTRDDAQWMANRLAKLRVFIDDTGRMNRALLDLPDHDLLIISQFTLCADTSGHRPGFSPAAAPDVAAPLIDQVVAICQTALARLLCNLQPSTRCQKPMDLHRLGPPPREHTPARSCQTAERALEPKPACLLNHKTTLPVHCVG